MRIKTIRRRLQTDGVSKTTLMRVHSKLYGISDEDTLPGNWRYSSWLEATAGIKRQQKYFRGTRPRKLPDFIADSFIKK